MSGVGRDRARRLRLVSGGQVTYLSSTCHQCKSCRATWDPLWHGDLCPHGCQDGPEGGAA